MIDLSLAERPYDPQWKPKVKRYWHWKNAIDFDHYPPEITSGQVSSGIGTKCH
jgi:hypothetical protein